MRNPFSRKHEKSTSHEPSVATPQRVGGVALVGAAHESALTPTKAYPLRKTTPNNQRHGAEGVSAGYLSPDPEIVKRIEEESRGKITYIPANGYEDPSEPGYSRDVMAPVYAAMRARFPGKPLALRAVMASLNGTLEGAFDGADIRDVTEVVANGREKDGNIFNVQILSPDEDQMDPYRVAQYAHDVGFNRHMYLDKEHADSVFPVVVVYDAELLQRPESGQGGHYGVELRSGITPEEPVLAAYILDTVDYS